MSSTFNQALDSRTFKGINFIRVRGTTAERARVHAVLLKEQAKTGPLPTLSKKNEWMIRRGPGPLQNPALQKVAVWFYKNLLVPMIDRRIEPEVRDAMAGMATELGFTYEEMRECVVQADAMMLLARSSLMKHFLPEWIPGGVPGCTSAVAYPSWTKSGRFLSCRNLDYLIVGPWENQATVVFNEPSDRGEIPYVALTSAGVQTGGLTSMNREGLTLFTHAHFGKNVTLRGNPVIVVGDEVIRKAKTLGQAIDLVKRKRPFANWSFVISSVKEQDAAVIHMTPDQVHVHRVEDGLLTHTNYFHSEELRKDEALLSGSYCEDLKARFCRMRQLIEPYRGHLEPQHLAKTLGDHVDYYSGQERVFGNALSVITTIKSAVFEPETQTFWMGNRKESPVGLGDFVEIQAERFWSQSLEELEASTQVLPGYRPKSPGLSEAVGHYRNAYRSFHLENDRDDYQERTWEHLQKAAEAFPQDAHLWIQAGIVAFKLHRFDFARRDLEKTREMSLSTHVGFVRDLYLARSLDLLGEREKALAIYTSSVDRARHEPKLHKAFKKGIRRPFRLSDSTQMVIDLQFPDTFVY